MGSVGVWSATSTDELKLSMIYLLKAPGAGGLTYSSESSSLIKLFYPFELALFWDHQS